MRRNQHGSKNRTRKNGFDACFFPTTAIYTSKPIILAIANEMPVTLGTGEYLMVYSDDTRPEVIPLGNNDVGGHVCLLTKINQNVYFIDPTAFSFQRIVGEIHNIMVPDVIVEKVQLSTIDFEVLRSYGVRNQPYKLPRIAFEFTFNKNTANLTKASFIYGRLHNPFAGDFNVANHSDVLERLAEKD